MPFSISSSNPTPLQKKKKNIYNKNKQVWHVLAKECEIDWISFYERILTKNVIQPWCRGKLLYTQWSRSIDSITIILQEKVNITIWAGILKLNDKITFRTVCKQIKSFP